MQFVTSLTKSSQMCLFRAGNYRIVNAPMNSLGGARKNRTTLIGMIADGDDVIEIIAQEFFKGLGSLVRNVDAKLAHHRDGLGSNKSRIRAGAENFKAVASEGSEQSFRHLATSGIAGAKEEDALTVTYH